MGCIFFYLARPIIFEGGFGLISLPMVSICRITYIIEDVLPVLFLLSY